MPQHTQHTQHSLTQVLLLWITTLSVVQVGFIIFFFTAGRSQNSSDVASKYKQEKIQSNTTPSPPLHPLGGGKMLTFKAAEVNRNIKWVPKNPDKRLISEERGGEVLRIKKDGYYFLTLQVTLSSCQAKGSVVSLKTKGKDLLKGWINNNTCSTGFLGKVEELSAGNTLEVIVNRTTAVEPINEDESHLDIIYMLKKEDLT